MSAARSQKLQEEGGELHVPREATSVARAHSAFWTRLRPSAGGREEAPRRGFPSTWGCAHVVEIRNYQITCLSILKGEKSSENSGQYSKNQEY